MSRVTVYVAGASSELDRARAAMALVRGCPHLGLAQDWVADIDREGGESNPADHALAYTYARRDLAAVLRADVFWLLMPHPGNRTIGTWFEAGAFTASCVQRPRPMIVSGAAPWRTIFASLADRYFDDDHSAFGALRDEAARVAAVREVK